MQLLFEMTVVDAAGICLSKGWNVLQWPTGPVHYFVGVAALLQNLGLTSVTLRK